MLDRIREERSRIDQAAIPKIVLDALACVCASSKIAQFVADFLTIDSTHFGSQATAPSANSVGC
jgi:hypothetical protein